MLLILDTSDVSLIPPVNSGGQLSALSQSEESGAPARRGSVEGSQAAERNEAFVLLIVLVKRRWCHLLQSQFKALFGVQGESQR